MKANFALLFLVFLLMLPLAAQVRFSEDVSLSVGHFDSIAYDDINIWANDASGRTLYAFDTMTGEKVYSVQLSDQGEYIAFDGMKFLMTQNKTKQIMAVNRANGEVIPYIDLKTVQGPRDMYMEPLRSGEIMGITTSSDRIWIGCGAGYSSSIYEIDPATNVVVSHRYSPGPTPVSLMHHNGNLWVLDRDTQSLRCLKDTKHLVYDLSIPAGENAISLFSIKEKAYIGRKGETNLRGVEKNTLAALVPEKLNFDIINPFHSKKRVSESLGAKKVAVLISGDTAASGYNEFWVDVVIMYQILEKRGYNDIYVLYADGKDYTCGWSKYEKQMADFSATKANVTKIFNALANGDSSLGINKMGADDILFVYTFDHGDSSGNLCLWSGERYSPKDMASIVKNIGCAKKMFYMQQCFSGAFKVEFTTAQLANMAIVTAASNTQYAYRADTEKEVYNGKTYYHGEFNWHFMSALAGATPDNQTVNADTNNDGIVSVSETYDYYKKMNSQSAQTPQYASAPETLGTTTTP